MKNLNLARINSSCAALLLAAACGGSADPEDSGDVGAVSLKLTAPEGTACVEEVVRNRVNGREKRRVFALTPGSSQVLEFEAAPAGDVELTALVTSEYDSDGCLGDIMYEAESQGFRLRPGARASVNQRFLARGDLDIDGTFEDDIYEGICDADPGASIGSWAEEFDQTSLASAWELFEFAGPRHNGQTSPANHYSLTAAPGNFRYSLDPMTYADPPTHNYEPIFDGTWYWYDPGVELARDLGGQHWSLETKVEWYVPNVVNAAGHLQIVRLGPPGGPGAGCSIMRYSNDDVGGGTSHTNNIITAGCGATGTPGSTWTEWAGLDTNILRYVRFERNGATLGIRMSEDGSAWQDVVSTTIPEEYACAEQRYSISGVAWFSPMGSYADYDYVRFDRQTSELSTEVPASVGVEVEVVR